MYNKNTKHSVLTKRRTRESVTPKYKLSEHNLDAGLMEFSVFLGISEVLLGVGGKYNRCSGKSLKLEGKLYFYTCLF